MPKYPLGLFVFFTSLCTTAFPQASGPSNGDKNAPQPKGSALAAYRENYQKLSEKLKKRSSEKTDNSALAMNLHLAWLAADLAGLKTEKENHQRELLLLNGQTIYESHLRKTLEWKGVTEILTELYCDDKNEFDPTTLASLSESYKVMEKEYEVKPTDKDTILLGFILGANIKLTPEFRASITNSEEGKAIRILTQKDTSPRDQIIDLEEISSLRLVNKYKTYLYESRLNAADLTSPLVNKIAAKSYLVLGQIDKGAKALQTIGNLEDKPEIAYLYALVLTEKGDFPKAIDQLRPIVAKKGDSPTFRKATELLGLLEHAKDYHAKADTLLKKSLNTVAANLPQSAYLRISGKVPGKGLVEGYSRLDGPTDSLEIVLMFKKAVVLAYRTDSTGTQFYFAESPHIIRTSKPGMVFAMSLTPKNAENRGSLYFGSINQGQGGINKSLQSTSLYLESLKQLKGPILANFKGIPNLVTDTIETPKAKEFSLMYSDFTKEELSAIKIVFDAKSLPQVLKWNTISLEVLSWDTTESEKKIANLWPKLPVKDQEEINMSDWMRLLSTAFSILGDLFQESKKVTG